MIYIYIRIKQTFFYSVYIAMSERVFIRPRRKAAEAAIGVLFADNSDDEPVAIDDEDEEFVTADFEQGIDESIIYSAAGEDTHIESVIKNVQKSNWDPYTPCLPPTIMPLHEYEELDDMYLELDNPVDIFLESSKLEDLINNIIIPESIRYAEQKGEILITDANEIKAFLDITILMGMHRLPAMRDYWSCDSELGVPFVTNIMTVGRFEFIRKLLHFNNDEKENCDRAHKLRPVIDHFNSAFLKAVGPSKHQSIDEHMVKYKGHNIMKQYIKNKPIKWGFKMWLRAAAKTGYVYEMDMYVGKKPQEFESSSHSLGQSVVLKLCKRIEDKGCIVAFDNFFSSVPLMEELHQKGIRSVATVRPNRRGLPRIQLEKNMNAGEVLGNVLENGKVTFVQWKDK